MLRNYHGYRWLYSYTPSPCCVTTMAIAGSTSGRGWCAMNL